MREKLKEMRREAGYSQVQLAEKCNLSERAIQNYEAESRTPNVYVALKIAAALGHSVEEVFGDESNN